jgi:hypothetical protein
MGLPIDPFGNLPTRRASGIATVRVASREGSQSHHPTARFKIDPVKSRKAITACRGSVRHLPIETRSHRPAPILKVTTSNQHTIGDNDNMPVWGSSCAPSQCTTSHRNPQGGRMPWRAGAGSSSSLGFCGLISKSEALDHPQPPQGGSCRREASFLLRRASASCLIRSPG